MQEDKLLADYRSSKDSQDVKYFTIEFITTPFSPYTIAEKARKSGVAQQLGYLAEVSALAARERGLLSEAERLEMLREELVGEYKEWRFLTPKPSDIVRGFLLSLNQTELNKKWKVYSTLTAPELSDWVDTYITQDFLREDVRTRRY